MDCKILTPNAVPVSFWDGYLSTFGLEGCSGQGRSSGWTRMIVTEPNLVDHGSKISINQERQAEVDVSASLGTMKDSELRRLVVIK